VDLASTAWSSSRLQWWDDPLRNAIASASIASLTRSEWGAQAVANTAWAVSTLDWQHEPLLNALSAAALPQIGHCGPQDLANTAWSFAKCSLANGALFDSIAAAALARISALTPQGLSNTAWAFAARSLCHRPLLHAIASAAQHRNLNPQELSNTAWAFAVLPLAHGPLMASIAAASLRRLGEFVFRNLANTAWAFATLSVRNTPLLAAIAAPAVPRMAELSALSLASTSWSCAQLEYADGPLLSAISAQVLRRLTETGGTADDGVVGMALSAAATLDNLGPAWELALVGGGASCLSLGPLVSACEWRHSVHEEVRAIELVARGCLQGPAAAVAALRLLECGAQGRPEALGTSPAPSGEAALEPLLRRLRRAHLGTFQGDQQRRAEWSEGEMLEGVQTPLCKPVP